MAFELMPSPIFLFRGAILLLEFDDFLAATVVSQVMRTNWPKVDLHNGLRRKPRSILEHMTRGLQQHRLNRH